MHFSVAISSIKEVSRGVGNEIIIEFHNEEKYKLKPITDKEVKVWLDALRHSITVVVAKRSVSSSDVVNVSDRNVLGRDISDSISKVLTNPSYDVSATGGNDTYHLLCMYVYNISAILCLLLYLYTQCSIHNVLTIYKNSLYNY